jgi:hypothetical protein
MFDLSIKKIEDRADIDMKIGVEEMQDGGEA